MNCLTRAIRLKPRRRRWVSLFEGPPAVRPRGTSRVAGAEEGSLMTHPHNDVSDCRYFRRVLSNMVGPSRGNLVRFGITGDGVNPNYQVEAPDRSETPYRGNSHQPFLDAPDGTFE